MTAGITGARASTLLVVVVAVVGMGLAWGIDSKRSHGQTGAAGKTQSESEPSPEAQRRPQAPAESQARFRPPPGAQPPPEPPPGVPRQPWPSPGAQPPSGPSPGVRSPSWPPPGAQRQPQLQRSQVLVTYKGGKITVGDLQDRMGMTLQHVLTSRHVSPDSFKAMIERLVDDTLKAREAERRGFGYDAEVLEATRREAVELFIREQFEAPKAGDSVSQEEVEKYYQEHLDEFHRPLSRRASQIVVRTRNQAATILREAGVLDMRRFRELVAKFSIDEDSKKRGGDLRYFDPKGRAVPLTSDHLEEDSVEPAVAQAVFALSGQQKVVPEPIQVSNGWAVVRMTAERPEYVYGFKRVAPQIRTRLLEKRKQARIDAHVAELRRKTVVEVHPELVDAIELEPPKK